MKLVKIGSVWVNPQNINKICYRQDVAWGHIFFIGEETPLWCRGLSPDSLADIINGDSDE
jgi:hypothetical protein